MDCDRTEKIRKRYSTLSRSYGGEIDLTQAATAMVYMVRKDAAE
jgi:hypothetical protein